VVLLYWHIQRKRAKFKVGLIFRVWAIYFGKRKRCWADNIPQPDLDHVRGFNCAGFNEWGVECSIRTFSPRSQGKCFHPHIDWRRGKKENRRGERIGWCSMFERNVSRYSRWGFERFAELLWRSFHNRNMFDSSDSRSKHGWCNYGWSDQETIKGEIRTLGDKSTKQKRVMSPIDPEQLYNLVPSNSIYNLVSNTIIQCRIVNLCHQKFGYKKLCVVNHCKDKLNIVLKGPRITSIIPQPFQNIVWPDLDLSTTEDWREKMN
jgi:hypothetical protein